MKASLFWIRPRSILAIQVILVFHVTYHLILFWAGGAGDWTRDHLPAKQMLCYCAIAPSPIMHLLDSHQSLIGPESSLLLIPCLSYLDNLLQSSLSLVFSSHPLLQFSYCTHRWFEELLGKRTVGWESKQKWLSNVWMWLRQSQPLFASLLVYFILLMARQSKGQSLAPKFIRRNLD